MRASLSASAATTSLFTYTYNVLIIIGTCVLNPKKYAIKKRINAIAEADYYNQ